jgi:hypothetical protein
MEKEKTRMKTMDFKKLISHIESIDGAIETPKAPTLPQAPQLNEDAQLRVLAGTSTILKESQMMEAELTKVGDTKKTAAGGTVTKTATGIKHTAKPWDGEDHAEPAQKKASKKGMTGAERRDQKAADKAQEKATKDWEKKYPGSVTRHKMKDDIQLDTEAFNEKFSKMVEAAKPDFLDVDKDGDKKEPMKKAAKEKGGEKKDGKKGMSDKQAKYFGKKNESKMMPKGKKRPVKESVEQKLSFKDMMKLVVESGGQQQIDPLDKELFAWAERVAKTKLGEGMKAEVYAGMVYERMGGVFEMYDVLSEDKE